MGVCGEKRNAAFMVNVYRIMQEICHLSCGIIARSLSMKANTDIKTHIPKQMHSFTQDLNRVTCLLLSETMH